MLHILYLLFIAPLEFLMRPILEWGFAATHSWGWALVLLSLTVNTALLPLYNWAERRQAEERRERREMARHEAMLRECFCGWERLALVSALRRLRGYAWWSPLRAGVGLFAQVPFFIAAYHLLSTWTPFSGQGFGPFPDLSAPDRLLSVGGFSLNILPFAMTAANLLAAFVYGRELARRDKAQSYGIALLFLALLYAAPSALTLYWTLNNLYALGKSVCLKGREPAPGRSAVIAPAMGGRLSARLGFTAATARRARPKSQAPPVPTERDTFILASLMGTVCGLFLWYFIPFCTYFHNTNEFDFNGWELFRKVAPYCLPTILAASITFYAASRFLPAECARAPWRRRENSGCRVGAVHTLALALMLAALIEGTLLSYELPQLAGEAELFDSKYRLLIDAVIWFDFLLIGTWYWRRMAKHAPVLLAVLAVFSCTSLLDFYRTSDDKIDARKFKGVNGLRMVDRESFFPELRFSGADNLIVLLVDSLDTLSFEKTLETHPDLKSVLDGFWVFRENLGPGGLTFYALPQILAGKVHGGDKFDDFVRDALVGEQSMAADALRHGRKVFIDANFWQVVSGEERIDADRLRRADISLRDYIDVFSFRFFPYWGKRLALGWVNYAHRDADAHMTSGDDINKRTFNKVIKRMPVRCEEGVLQFIYFFGAHEPFIKKDIIETTHEFMRDFGVFLDALKSFGLHDKSTLVVMADHGLYSKDYRHWFPERRGTQPTALFPLFMVKTPGSTGEPVFREEPTSSVYLGRLARRFYEKGASNDVMAEWLSDLPAVRYVYEENVGKFEARGTFSSMTLEKAASGPRARTRP